MKPLQRKGFGPLGRVRVTPGFWVLLALVWALEPELLAPAALAAGLHELGHCIALRLCGARVSRFSLTGLGAVLEPEGTLPYRRELPVALAGPGASLLCAWAAAHFGFYLLAGLSISMGIFNLLPIFPLDGGRAARSLCALILPGRAAQGVPKWLSIGTAGFFLGAAWVMFLRFGGIGVLLCAIWLGYRSIRELTA